MIPARATLLVTAAIAAAISLGGLGVACSSGTPVVVQPPKSCTLQVVGMTIIASPKINPEEDGSPRPVQLRLYQLKTDTRLLNASFDQIWKDDKATLQDDLVKVDEFPVYPDTRTEVKFERDPAALAQEVEDRLGLRAIAAYDGLSVDLETEVAAVRA